MRCSSSLRYSFAQWVGVLFVPILGLLAACGKSSVTALQTTDCLQAVIRRHPISLAAYVQATGLAGDVRFVASTVQENKIFTEYGDVIPASQNTSGVDKANPQPTYLAPLHTPVVATVNGVVAEVATLWSTPTLGDVSVRIRPDGIPTSCNVLIETEHVLLPRVAVGDRVTVGQTIAEVGTLNQQYNSGLGEVEFGYATAQGTHPMHVCPYAYFAPDVASAQVGLLQRLMADWESCRSLPALWNESTWVGGIPGCAAGPIIE